MSKPIVHAQQSVKKYGGRVEDYLPLHELMDLSKSAHARVCHRAVFHHGLGPLIMEKIFGVMFTNSDGEAVCVRDLAEEHILQDLGTIPSLDDWLREIPCRPWMAGAPRRPRIIVGEEGTDVRKWAGVPAFGEPAEAAEEEHEQLPDPA